MEEAVGVRNGRDFSEGCWQHTVNDNKLVQRGLRVKHCAKCLNILTHHAYAASQSLSLSACDLIAHESSRKLVPKH